jgi:hypothetical protein
MNYKITYYSDEVLMEILSLPDTIQMNELKMNTKRTPPSMTHEELIAKMLENKNVRREYERLEDKKIRKCGWKKSGSAFGVSKT